MWLAAERGINAGTHFNRLLCLEGAFGDVWFFSLCILSLVFFPLWKRGGKYSQIGYFFVIILICLGRGLCDEGEVPRRFVYYNQFSIVSFCDPNYLGDCYNFF